MADRPRTKYRLSHLDLKSRHQILLPRVWLEKTNEQAALAAQIPTLNMCKVTIPAVLFGTYDFPTDTTIEVKAKNTRWCLRGRRFSLCLLVARRVLS